MKNYIKYLKENPIKIVLPILFLLFSIAINIVVNITDSNIYLSIGVALFTLLTLCLINLQVWGEYKRIEGFLETVKQFFYGV
jgi:hypothetical protein